MWKGTRRELRDQVGQLTHLGRWVVLGSISGVLAGLSSGGFLWSLDKVTELRLHHPWLLWLLPVAGLVTGAVYHYAGGEAAAAGNNVIIDEIHEPRAWIPRRMAPLIYAATLLTHVVGGSAGREGTALQMSGSLTDAASRVLRLGPRDRRIMLIAALGGGFGAVFGVPAAGCVFGLEVQSVGSLRYDALVATLTASAVGDLVVHGVGIHHTPTPALGPVHLTVWLLLRLAVAGIAFGLAARAFAELTHAVHHWFQALRWPPLRPVLGGFLLIGLTYAVGNRDYNGLSVPLVTRALAGGTGVIAVAFALKLVFTSLTLGSGFQGGEVTPLFVIGGTLGVTMGHLLHVSVPLMAAVGFVAVFAGAANVPLACTVMAGELFGATALLPAAIVCVVAYTASGDSGIYHSQRVGVQKWLGAAPDPEAD
jgi:H+/Cl- antiporter ClcA